MNPILFGGWLNWYFGELDNFIFDMWGVPEEYRW